MKVIFTILLSMLLFFSVNFSAQAAVTDSDLQSYLQEIELTSEELNAYLASYDLTIADFENIDDLRDTLGPRVTTETLNQLLADYDLTKEELEALLKEYGELEEGISIEETFLFISDIEDIIDLDTSIEDIDFTELEDFFSELGITEDEFTKFIDHMTKISEQDPSLSDKLVALSERMITFSNFETINELSSTQISAFLAITDELKNLLQLDFSFYLVKDGAKTPISFKNLLNLEQANGANLQIEVYSTSGELLLDLVLTGEMIGSDIIQDTGKVIENTTNKVVNPSDQSATIKGGKLPNTAGDYMATFLFGLALLGGAFFTFRKVGAMK